MRHTIHATGREGDMDPDQLSELRASVSRLADDAARLVSILDRLGREPRGADKRPAVGARTSDPDAAAMRGAVLIDPIQAVRRVLADRGVTVRSSSVEDDGGKVLDALAIRTGRAAPAFEGFLAVARRAVSQDRAFRYTLPRGQPQNGEVVAVAQRLAALGLLAGFRYDRHARALAGQPVGPGRKFLSGGWLERFVAVRMRHVAGAEVHGARRLVVTLRDGRGAELDWFGVHRGQPVWIETRSGQFVDRLDHYVRLRRALGVADTRALVVAACAGAEQAVAVSDLHGIRVVPLTHLDDALGSLLAPSSTAPLSSPTLVSHPAPAETGAANREALRAARMPLPAVVSAPLASREATAWEDWLDPRLLVALRRARLRPHARVRLQVLGGLAAILQDDPTPRSVTALRAELAARLEVPRTAVVEVLHAALRGGALADRDGDTVLADDTRIAGLAPAGADSLERCCRAAYRAALRAADPTIDCLAAVPEP